MSISELSFLFLKIIQARSRSKVVSIACKTLATVLKDHDLPRAVALAEVSKLFIIQFWIEDLLSWWTLKSNCYFFPQESAIKYLNTVIPSSSEATISSWDPEFGKKPVRIILTETCPQDLCYSIRQALDKIKSFTRLEWDFVDKGELGVRILSLVEYTIINLSGSTWNFWKILLTGPRGGVEERNSAGASAVPMAVNNPIVDMVNIFNYAMEKANCRYREGRVYQFVPGSVTTYSSA